MKKTEEKKEYKIGLIVFAVSAVICFIAVGYAAWTKVYEGTKENSIDTATLILTLDENESNEISLIHTVPVSDAKGLTFEPYTFKLKNSGTIKAKYRIKLVNDDVKYSSDGCSNKKLDWSNIKYSFKKNDEVATTGILSDVDGVLNLGEIDANHTDKYSLILWIKSEATNEIMDQHFHGKIKVDAIQNDQDLDD